MTNRWVQEDIDFLKEFYSEGAQFCADTLGRTYDAIKHKAAKLGIKSNKYWMDTNSHVDSLIEKKIFVFPLEEYKTARTPILYECEYGHQWKNTPDNILRGSGCPSCSKTGFDSNKPGLLYYIKITKDNETYYKIGITNRSVLDRFHLDSDKQISILYEKWYENGSDARYIEQEYLKNFKDSRVNIKGFLKSGGNTELFEIDVLNKEVPY